MPTHLCRANDPHVSQHYFSALDGLRALAVLAVLFYHADMIWMPGGFLGVECFFVLSGFLITSMLRDEWQRNRTIDLRRFWLRRAARLMPALLVLIIVFSAFVLLFVPDEAAELRDDSFAALAYITNWWLIVRQESYFAALERPSLLQHLWSLAIEMQFYLVWPLILRFGLSQGSGVWGRGEEERRSQISRLQLPALNRQIALAITLLGAASSALLMAWLYQPDVDPSRIYYGSDTRMAGILIGAALALVYAPSNAKRDRHHQALDRAFAAPRERLLAFAVDALGIVAVAELATTMVRIDEFDQRLYHGGFAAVALLMATLIIAVCHPRARLLPAVLAWQPLRWLGTRSYSIYLWHWPIFLFTRPQLDLALEGLPLLVLRFGISLVCAELSYRLVEQPMRRGALSKWWRAARFGQGWRRLAIATPGVALIIALVGTMTWLGGAFAHATTSIPEAELAFTTQEAPASPVEVAKSEPAFARSAMLADIVQATVLPTSVLPAATHAPSTSQPTQIPTTAAIATPTPGMPTHVVAIGDSVMVGASKELRRVLGDVTIDAQVSRQAKAAEAIVQSRYHDGQLGDAVVLHIGTNGPFSLERFTAMMAALETTPRVVVVNVKVPRRWEQPNNAMLAQATASFPNVRLVDWYSASAAHPEFFRRDGIHLKPPGVNRYVELIVQALTEP